MKMWSKNRPGSADKTTEPSTDNVNRRAFLKTTIGIGAVGLFTALVIPKEKDPQAEALVDKLKELPGVGKINIYSTTGATKQIVHISQFHEVPQMTAEQQQKVKASQSDIQKILLSLMDHKQIGLKQVFVESETAETRRLHRETQGAEKAASNIHSNVLDILKDQRTSIVKTLEKYGNDGIAGQRLEARLKDLETEIAEKEKAISERIKAKPDSPLSAVDNLEKQGLRIRHGETLKENLEARAAFSRKNMSAADWQEVLIDRERTLLDILTKEQENTSFFIYGANHDFRKAVSEWNQTHPNAKISLIEVIPQSHLNR